MSFKRNKFIEIACIADLEICESRDPKGLYKKARAGEIPDFTGISSPYEVPSNPEILIETDVLSIKQSAHEVLSYLKRNQILDL